MCEDCISVAGEYQFLNDKRKLALINAETEIDKLRMELKFAKRRAELMEQTAKAGIPDIIVAWMDNNFADILR